MLRLTRPDGSVVVVSLPLELRNGARIEVDRREAPCVTCGVLVALPPSFVKRPARLPIGTVYCDPCFADRLKGRSAA